MLNKTLMVLVSMAVLCGLSVHQTEAQSTEKVPPFALYGLAYVDDNNGGYVALTQYDTEYVISVRTSESGPDEFTYIMGTDTGFPNDDWYYLQIEEDVAEEGDLIYICINGALVNTPAQPYTVGASEETLYQDLYAQIPPGSPGPLTAFVGIGSSPDFSKVDIEFTAAGGNGDLGTPGGYEAKILQSATEPADWASAGDSLGLMPWSSLQPFGQQESRTINLASAMTYGESYYISIRAWEDDSGLGTSAYPAGYYGPMVTAKVNMPPAVSGLSITPASPLTGDNLTANYSCSDPEGESCSVAIVWLKGGVPQSYTGATLPSSATAEDDVWSFSATPSDPHREGVTETSASVTIQNSPPTADAGGPYTVKVDSVFNFNGSGSSDPDGDPLTYSWDFDTSAPPTEDSTEENPQHTYTVLGTYDVTLTVTDDDAASDTDTTTVNVVVNAPPTITDLAVSSEPPLIMGQPVSFTCTVNDTDDPLENMTCSWDFDNNGVVDETSTSSTWTHTATWTYATHGMYTVSVTVSDPLASSYPSYIEDLTILAPPEAAFTWAPEPQDEGSPIAFTDASTQADGTIASWSWDFDASDGIQEDSTDQNPSHTYIDNDTYTVTLTVTDDDGLTDTVSHDVTVTDLGPTAEFSWTPDPADEGSAVQFTDESISSPDAIVSWTWNFGDGVGTSTEQDPSYTYLDNGTYTVTLTVTDDDGSVSEPVSHDVVVNDLGPTTEFSWTPDPPDEGALVQFADETVSFPDAIFSWSWDFDSSDGIQVDSTEQNPSHTYPDNGTYTVTLTVIDDDESTDTVSHDVVVSDLVPTAEFSWTPDPPDEGALIQFTDESVSSPDAIVSWSWDFDASDGIGEDSTAQDPTHTYAEDGTYTVTLTVTDDDQSTDTVSHDVVVSDLAPTAAFSWTPTSPDEGAQVDFTDESTASAGDPIVSWLWDFGDDSGTSIEQDPSYTYAENGTYSVALTVTDDDGSENTVSHDIVVADLAPTAAFTWDPEPQAEGSAVTFTDDSTASAGDPIASWSWTFGDSGTSAAQNPSHTYTDDGIYTVTLEVTDDDGSTDSISHDVTITDLGPTAAFTWTPTSPDEGAAVAFTDTSTSSPDEIASWSWTFGDGGTSTAQNPSHTYTDDGTYTVTLTVTDDDGSTDAVSHSVMVLDLAPTAAFTWTPTSPDEGSAVAFTDASTSSPDTIDSWSWSFGDGGASAEQSPSYTYTDDGTYTVTLTVTDDDGSTDAVSHDVVVADLSPVAAFTWTPTSPAEGSAVAFTDASTSSPDAIASWSWSFGDGGASTDQNPSYTYTDDGTYTVTLTVVDDDGSTDAVSHDVVVTDLGPTAAFSWAPEPQAEGSPVQFTDESTSVEDAIGAWAWAFGDSGVSAAQNPAHVYADNGAYAVSLTVTDDDGSTDAVSHDVTITNVAPIAQATPGQLDQEVAGRDLVFLSLGFTDPGTADTHSATINWGDGNIEDGAVAQLPGSGTVTGSHSYRRAGVYCVTIAVEDDDGGTMQYLVTITVTGIELLSATYDVLDTLLTLTFDDPVMPMLTCFDGIGMEIEDSGEWNFALSDQSGLRAETGAGGPNTLEIDLNHAIATVKNLVFAALVEHKDVDIVLGLAAIKDSAGNENVEVLPEDDIPLEFITHGYNLGKSGDVSGDGGVSAYDAALILQGTVSGDDVYPISGVAKDASLWFAAYGIDVDVVEETADINDDGAVNALDATTALQTSAGLLTAPALSGSAKKGKLSVNNCDDGRLDVSIDLDDVKNVYCAEIVMTYNPQRLTVADVSKTYATSEWMSADAAEAGKLRIALAGASQPISSGSLVTVSFDGNALQDAIKQLDITEFKLNGGWMEATVENLPKTFALLQNYPNPFNPETWIPYRLSLPAEVAVTIYNMNGQMVRRLELGSKMPGHYMDKSKAAYWDGRNEFGEMVSSGIYFYQLQAGRDASVRKMIILK